MRRFNIKSIVDDIVRKVVVVKEGKQKRVGEERRRDRGRVSSSYTAARVLKTAKDSVDEVSEVLVAGLQGSSRA